MITMKNITISISDQQYNWFERHEEINRSGYIKKLLDKEMPIYKSVIIYGANDKFY